MYRKKGAETVSTECLLSSTWIKTLRQHIKATKTTYFAKIFTSFLKYGKQYSAIWREIMEIIHFFDCFYRYWETLK
jgi:hypothetical protein